MNPVMVVEDDRKIANVVRAYMEGAGYRVVLAGNGPDAVQAALRETPLAVILDLMLPGKSGEEVCQELKEIGDFPVIMLTSKSSEEERVAGFALGADDYVVKPFSPRELVYRLKAVLRRAGRDGKDADNNKNPLSFNCGQLVLDGRTYEVRKRGGLVKITPTEFKVLLSLASNPGKVFTREELVEAALGYQFEGYERSVDAHIKNIRRKMEDDPKNPSLIITIYGLGYRFSGKKDVLPS
ncbi:MAG: response regulator transcription factor [Nitrospiraceae bacterium]|nr:response regulator transcription factor [Nitrospiraceae bacterium]